VDVKSVESTKTKATINLTLVHQVDTQFIENIAMSAYVGDKLIRTWEDDHEASRTYLHQFVTLFWNFYMYFQYLVIMVLQIHAIGTTKVIDF
jgi:hypothetical protein